MSRADEFKNIIRSLRQAVPDVTGAMVVSADGMAIANDLPGAESQRVAAMAATGLGLGRRIAQGTNTGSLEEIVIRGDEGYVIIYAAGEKGVLAALASPDANLGLIHLEARDAAERVGALMHSTARAA